MTSKRIPLEHNGEIVGEAEVYFDDEGMYVKGTMFNSEKAAEILQPSVNAVSMGFNFDGVDFSGVIPTNFIKKYEENNEPR